MTSIISLARRARCMLLYARLPKNQKQPGSVRSPRGLKASRTAGTHGKAAHGGRIPRKNVINNLTSAKS